MEGYMVMSKGIVSWSSRLCVALATSCIATDQDVGGGGGGGVAAESDDCAPGVAPRCFALDPDIYKASADMCHDVWRGSIVVACVDDRPPPSQCVALHQDLDREVRYCCCDPRKDPSCNVVP